MGVRVTTQWRATQEVEPPDGVSVEQFAAELRANDPVTWGHALDQTDSSTAELVDWDVGG